MAARELSDLEALLGHRFAHRELLEEALTHGSLRHEQQTAGDTSLHAVVRDNERLEFLGDAIVGLVVAEQLYRRYPELQEGELTRLRAALVSRKHLGTVGLKLELGSYLHLGRAEERSGGRKKAVLLANCVEAVIAALYLEAGLSAASEFVERVVTEPYLSELRSELREHRAIGDYKSALQELLQSRRLPQPEYIVKAETGPDHRKRFLVEVRVGPPGQESRKAYVTGARGEGSTKKKAEQEAARRAYEEMSSPRTGEGWGENISDAQVGKHPTDAEAGSVVLARRGAS
jgi:ribonuclease-3